MRPRCLFAFVLLVLSVARAGAQPSAPAAAVLSALEAPDAAALGALWDGLPPRPPAPSFTHALVTESAQRLASEGAGLVSIAEIGRSVEGRTIWHLSAGRGPMRVLLWSQMHGDEPSATPALLDLLQTLIAYRSESRVARLLNRLTLDIVPMLNPDGAERFQRRNAQGIDVNRDALRLQTPEGRALKALRDRLSPAIGFNLHNQNWRTSVGRTPPRPATISVLAVAFDEARTENAGRLLTKRTCAVIRDAVEALVPGQVGRYDDEFEVRAFGDNVTRWGTPVVLIETGPLAGPAPDRALTRLNFVALMTALDALASGRVHEAAAARYETLPLNEDRLFHTLIVNATIVAGTGVAPFVGDVGVTVQRSVRVVEGERRLFTTARIEDVGDLQVFGALERIDATGKLLAPLAAPSLSAGATVRLEEQATLPAQIGPGQPAAFMLLSRGAEPGSFVVDRVIRAGDQAAPRAP
jgi:hypothetical protein